MVFNLIPIPPLDGAKIFAFFLPILENRKLEIYGPIILIGLLLIGGFSFISPIINFIVLSVLKVNPLLL
jgi:Zn-dependent protease